MTARLGEAPVILIADDSQANCELLAEQLHSLGFRTIMAHDARAALAAVWEHRPDLVILDVQMPAGDLEVADRSAGYEVCRRIKADPASARIPIVFVTALTESTDRLLAIEAGGDDFLVKPHNRLVLGARVRSLLRLKTATDALEESFKRLRELERVRDDLMKMIVHDLKTPLTSILATLELLGDGDLGPLETMQRSAVQDAMGKSDELLNLIDDLLEVRRIEETSIALTLEEIDTVRLVDELIRESASRFEQERTTVHRRLDEAVPPIRGDRALLRRVLGNLIQNALIHSARPIDLWLAIQLDEAGVRISVRDNGPGIAPEFHESIFRKFQKGAARRESRPRTSGLGLTFCRLVVEAHGGRIWVESAVGEGSTFHVLLPVDPPSQTMRLGASP
ncbi:MAG: response regulator [Gemmatimonadaceae bacterium]|nr:response regulator [Gemmatimonadaceae bacterium]